MDPTPAAPGSTTTPASPASTAEPTSRRNVLYGGVAVAAAVAGAGFAWWRHTPGTADSTALEGFWSSNFETPEGAPLPMAAFRGKPLLLNFWATWCPPCVEEMPLLDAFFRERAAKGWQVVGLAIDQPSAVRKFLARLPVSFPIGMAGLQGTEIVKMLGNTSGGLPFSLVLSAGGAVLHRRMGRVTAADLKDWGDQA